MATYRLGKLLGAGGMAEVYLGQEEAEGGIVLPVAIKRVRDAHATDPQFLAAFREEANLAARLAHPNIVRVLDFQRDAKGVPFLVMEYVAGKDLSALARQEALPCSLCIYILANVLRALAYAHDLPVTAGVRGVVHRDVSPQNVLLSWLGEVKVSDFGIAKAFSTSLLAHSTTIRGKPGFMSPEQVNAEPLDGRSDLFSAGVVFWELLTGKPLFEMTTYRETMARVLFANVPRPSDVAPTPVPKDVEAVVLRLLERDRNARYATAHEAITDLNACDAAPKDGMKELVDHLNTRFDRPRSVTPMFGLALSSPPPGAEGEAPQAHALTVRAPESGEVRRTRTMDVPTTGPHDKTMPASTSEPWRALTLLSPSAAAPPSGPIPHRFARARWAALGALVVGAAVATAIIATSSRTSGPTAASAPRPTPPPSQSTPAPQPPMAAPAAATQPTAPSADPRAAAPNEDRGAARKTPGTAPSSRAASKAKATPATAPEPEKTPGDHPMIRFSAGGGS